MEEPRYNVSSEILERADIKGEPEDMRQWLDSLSNEEIEDWYLIASRDKGTNSAIELTEAMFKAIVLMSYELDTMELGLTADKAKEVTQRFLLNIIIHKGIRDGLYELDGKLSLVLAPDVKLTELGIQIAKQMGLDNPIKS